MIGEKKRIIDMKINKVLTLASLDAGNPSFFDDLKPETINSRKMIIDSDQYGIIFCLQSHIRGMIVNILSAAGSIIAPKVVFRFNFFAK